MIYSSKTICRKIQMNLDFSVLRVIFIITWQKVFSP